MTSRFLAGAAALVLTATTVLATSAPASAQRWHGHRGFGWGAAGLAAGVVGGAVAAATSPFWAPGYHGYGDGYYPGYAYGPAYSYDDAYAYQPGYAYGTAPNYSYSPGYAYNQGYAVGGRGDFYCAQRYRSYDPASGTYLGYDGIRHPCS